MSKRKTLGASCAAVVLMAAGTVWGLEGDVNLDGVVDVRDSQAVDNRLGCAVGEGSFACDVADVNRDGDVNPFDTKYVVARYGEGEQTLRIGPIAGLTAAWHAAPAETFVCRGTTLEFRVTASLDATVQWEGAEEVGRNSFDASARSTLNVLGSHVVSVTVTSADGETLDLTTSLNVVDVPIEQISLGGIIPSVSPLNLDEDSSNEETMDYYFGESIASLTALAPGHYVTSVDRTVELTAVNVVPAGFAPLMEWRVDGIPYDMGSVGAVNILGVGTHRVSGGPQANQQRIQVDTYSVTITGQFEGDIIPEGVAVTFEAVTDPPGYEDRVTWLSSTKYGTAAPVLGQGPTFTIQFDDTFEEQVGGFYWQWLGVKGDNFALGQDQKPCGDIVSFTAECDEGELTATVAYADDSHDGETVLVVIEDWGTAVPIVGLQATRIETDIVGDNVEVWIAEVGCEEFRVQFVNCGGAPAGNHCEVGIDEIATFNDCEFVQCPISLPTYCTKVGCTNNTICSNINKIVRRCEDAMGNVTGYCQGDTVAPQTCTCP